MTGYQGKYYLHTYIHTYNLYLCVKSKIAVIQPLTGDTEKTLFQFQFRNLHPFIKKVFQNKSLFFE